MPALALHGYPVLHGCGLRLLRPGWHDVQRGHLYERAALLVLLLLQQRTACKDLKGG